MAWCRQSPDLSRHMASLSHNELSVSSINEKEYITLSTELFSQAHLFIKTSNAKMTDIIETTESYQSMIKQEGECPYITKVLKKEMEVAMGWVVRNIIYLFFLIS